MPREDCERTHYTSSRFWHNMNADHLRKPALTIVMMLLVGGCSHVANPGTDNAFASDWTFQPPAGWRESTERPRLLGFALNGPRIWKNPNSPGLLTLQVLPALQKSDEATSPFLTQTTNITVCRGLKALSFQKRSPLGLAISDGVSARSRTSNVIVLYTYSAKASPNSLAEASLRSICPRH